MAKHSLAMEDAVESCLSVVLIEGVRVIVWQDPFLLVDEGYVVSVLDLFFFWSDDEFGAAMLA